jgi:DNA-binding MarR family transcriptional regulator
MPRATAPTSEATDLFFALGAVVKRLRHNPLPDPSDTGATLNKANFASRHISALLHIAAEGPIGMTELAERLHVSLATMSQLVTELDDWQLVERKQDDVDRRRILVTIASDHRPMIRAMLVQRLQPLQRTLNRLDPDQREAFVHGLTVLAEELDRIKETKENCR